MRTLIIGSVLAMSIASVGHGQTQQSGRNTVYIAPNMARTVTISRSGVILTTLAVPQGTIISVTYDTAGSVLPSGDGRVTFHGNVEVRVMAAGQRQLKLEDAILQAPIQLTASGVDVSIAPQ